MSIYNTSNLKVYKIKNVLSWFKNWTVFLHFNSKKPAFIKFLRGSGELHCCEYFSQRTSVCHIVVITNSQSPRTSQISLNTRKTHRLINLNRFFILCGKYMQQKFLNFFSFFFFFDQIFLKLKSITNNATY